MEFRTNVLGEINRKKLFENYCILFIHSILNVNINEFYTIPPLLPSDKL